MSTIAVNSIRIPYGQAAATLTWWHHGWLEYALRLDTPTGSFEAVEDSWFAALAALARETEHHLPTGESEGPAESPEDHRAQWTRWLSENFG